MLSEATARLVDDAALLDDPELVHHQGRKDPVPARRLLGMAAFRRGRARADTGWARSEMEAIDGFSTIDPRQRDVSSDSTGPAGDR